MLDRSAAAGLPAAGPDLRTARREDYAFLYHAGADLRTEELLEDPRVVDPVAFARRVEEECRDGWTWVLRDARGLCFRAGVSALTSEAAQISGVYVPPALRGRAASPLRALGELCTCLIQRSRVVCLFVNDFNEPALNLYRRLGFRASSAPGRACSSCASSSRRLTGRAVRPIHWAPEGSRSCASPPSTSARTPSTW